MVNIQKTKKGQYTITISLDIIQLKKWKKGTKLYSYINEKGELVLKEIK